MPGEAALPGFQNFTTEQLFFLAYANVSYQILNSEAKSRESFSSLFIYAYRNVARRFSRITRGQTVSSELFLRNFLHFLVALKILLYCLEKGF